MREVGGRPDELDGRARERGGNVGFEVGVISDVGVVSKSSRGEGKGGTTISCGEGNESVISFNVCTLG